VTTVGMAELDDVRASIKGEVALPGEPAYAEAVSIWNGSIERRPSVVIRCAETGDVVKAVRFARASGLEISVRGGGHSFAGHSLTEGGVMIDLTPMKSVTVDPEARRAKAGGGVTWGEFDAATQEHGLAVPGGMISHTGIAGLTLGGGIGWLCTLAGLTCDNLVGAELVTADGEVLAVSEESEPDLLWALKGGGGNFGIVTSFEYRLHQVGPMVNFGFFYWRPDRGTEVLRYIREVIPTLPRDTASFIASTNAPDEAFVPEELRGQAGWVLAIVGFGDADAHERLVEPIRKAIPADCELVEPLPYTVLQGMFDHTAPWGALAYEKAVHLDDLSDDVIEVLVTHQPAKTARLSFTPILVAAGAYHDIPESSSAFSGSRQTRYVINITAVCETQEEFVADREWVRNYWAALSPHAGGLGSYVNFMSEFDEDRVRSAYGAEKYARLSALKRRLDPDNSFHLNANIRPNAS
jgi:FAD/FMN-containing dehydrogenase